MVTDTAAWDDVVRWVQRFPDDLTVVRSADTVRAYAADVRRWVAFCQRMDTHPFAARPRLAIDAILDAINVLIDGPYVRALAESAGPWTGSGNQRVIDLVETRRVGRVALWDEHSLPVLPCPTVRPGTHGESVGKIARPNFPVDREDVS
jgi:hypothetical protein